MTVLSGFSLIPPLPRLCLKLQTTAIGWLGQRGRLRSLSRGQTSIFIDMPLCLQCENIISDSRGKGKKKSNMRISWLRLCLTNVPISYPKLKIFFFLSKVFFFFFHCREVGVKSMKAFRWKSRTKKAGGRNWIKCSHIISVIIIYINSFFGEMNCVLRIFH